MTLEWQGPRPLRELFEKSYQTNVFGSGCLAEAALPLLEKSKFPRIINVSSTLGSIEFQLTPDTGYPIEMLMVCNFIQFSQLSYLIY
jgi:NAD(P)-dependent dehydrogenase (short-subunit alcohol dehydrogenase family)